MTRGLLARILLAVFFLGLLASPLVIKRLSLPQESAAPEFDTQAALARHGFYFEEVSRAAGIDFVHQGPALDRRF